MPRGARALPALPSTGQCQQGTYLPPRSGERQNYSFPGQQGCFPAVILPVPLPALPAALSAQWTSSEEEVGRAQLTPTEQHSQSLSKRPQTGFVCSSFILSSNDPVEATFRKTILYTY